MQKFFLALSEQQGCRLESGRDKMLASGRDWLNVWNSCEDHGVNHVE